MQALIAIPELKTLQRYGGPEKALLRSVDGVPLLVRTLLSAKRAGAECALVLWPVNVPDKAWQICRAWMSSRFHVVMLLQPNRFRPRRTLHWEGIARLLQEELLWVPWNWVADEEAMSGLRPSTPGACNWGLPSPLDRGTVLRGECLLASPVRRPAGVSVVSAETARQAERILGRPKASVLRRWVNVFRGSLIFNEAPAAWGGTR